MPTRWPSKDETILEILPFHTRGGPLLKEIAKLLLRSSFAKKHPSTEGYLLHPSQLRWEGLRPLRDGGGVGLYHPTEERWDWTTARLRSASEVLNLGGIVPPKALATSAIPILASDIMEVVIILGIALKSIWCVINEVAKRIVSPLSLPPQGGRSFFK